MQLGEHGLKPIHVRVWNPFKELVPKLSESGPQARCDAPSAIRRRDDEESMVPGVALAQKKTASLELVDKASDFPLVSTHRTRQVPGRSGPVFHAVKKHRRLLRGHPKLAEASVKHCL
jgi:hypothetical protein